MAAGRDEAHVRDRPGQQGVEGRGRRMADVVRGRQELRAVQLHGARELMDRVGHAASEIRRCRGRLGRDHAARFIGREGVGERATDVYSDCEDPLGGKLHCSEMLPVVVALGGLTLVTIDCVSLR